MVISGGIAGYSWAFQPSVDPPFSLSCCFWRNHVKDLGSGGEREAGGDLWAARLRPPLSTDHWGHLGLDVESVSADNQLSTASLHKPWAPVDLGKKLVE